MTHAEGLRPVTPHKAGSLPAPATVDWRRNLAAIAFSQFTVKFGFAFATPFVPVFLNRELHVRSGPELALWTGIVGGATGLGVAVGGPVWGAVADRFGRKKMLIRAMAGGGLVMVITAFVQTPVQLAAARSVLGFMAGTVAAANAMVAAETPRRRVGLALGILSALMAVGQAFGPLVGGLLSLLLGLRRVFVGGGLLILLPVAPVAALVHETAAGSRAGGQPQQHCVPLVRFDRTTLLMVGLLVTAQALTAFSFWSAQQFAVVHIIDIDPANAPIATGVAFTALGLATAVAAVSYSWMVARAGFRRVAVVAALLMGMAILAVAFSNQLALLVVAIAALGLVYGALNPALASMLGLEAPNDLKATVFGVSASGLAVGQALGPLTSGALAAAYGVSSALIMAALAVAVGGIAVWVWGREPVI